MDRSNQKLARTNTYVYAVYIHTRVAWLYVFSLVLSLLGFLLPSHTVSSESLYRYIYSVRPEISLVLNGLYPTFSYSSYLKIFIISIFIVTR